MKGFSFVTTTKGVARALLLLASFLMCTERVSLAADPVATCQSKKLGATGRLAKAVLGCSAKAAKKGDNVDVECVAKATDKHDDSYAGEGSVCAGNAGASAALTAAASDALFDGILGGCPSVSCGTLDLCGASQLKAAGKYASSALKAEGKFLITGDSGKRADAIAKAVGKLDSAFAAAAAKYTCDGTLDSTETRAELDAMTSGLMDCVVDGEDCDGGGGTVAPGGSVTTDSEGGNATPSDPIETTVTSPQGGVVAIVETEAGSDPVGVEVFGRVVDITATDSLPHAPLTLLFVVDASEVAGHVPADLVVLRDGVVVADCSGGPGIASPDPCVESRSMLGDGDFAVSVLTSQASLWTVGVAGPCPISMTYRPQSNDGATGLSTNLEIGWTGLGHNQDPTDDFGTTLALDCFGAMGPTCPTCNITGIIEDDHCRCANDPRAICDEHDVADFDDCGGNQCQCWAQPPMPVSVGTPVCVTRRFSSDTTGTWAPNAGSGNILTVERFNVYGGVGQFEACPTCVGDPIANDGIRGGLCENGPHDGLSCDVQGTATQLDVGAGLSLDCFPDPLQLLGGGGMRVTPSLTTGAVAALGGIDACDAPLGAYQCPCGACSGDTAVPCHIDADCALLGLGTCGSGGGPPRQPNGCSDLTCDDQGGEMGECNGQTDSFCDGKVRADGTGVLVCNTNADCAGDCGGGPGSCGDCTIEEQRPCFLEPIDAVGSPSSAAPKLAATACMAASGHAAVNSAFGLPGPVRMTLDTSVTYEQ